MATIKSEEDLAKIVAISAAKALIAHGVSPKSIKAGEGLITGSHPSSGWYGIWVDENPHIPSPMPEGRLWTRGPIWIGYPIPELNPERVADLQKQLEGEGLSHPSQALQNEG